MKATFAGRPRRGQRGGVLHRLGRPAAERAEPVRAGAVLHRQRRRRDAAAASSSSSPPGRTRRRLFGDVGLHERAFRRRQRVERRGRVGQPTPQHARLHRHASAPSRAPDQRRRSRCSAAPRRCSTARFKYDDANTARPGRLLARQPSRRVRGTRYFFAEVWMRNAFDTRYVPVAFPYPGFAPSGFIGEVGRPRTFGVSAGVTF